MKRLNNRIIQSRQFTVLFLVSSVHFLFMSGCMQPVNPGETRVPSVMAGPKPAIKDEASPPLESNIVRVSKFFSSEPWLAFDDDGTGRINGFRCTVYLEGAGQPMGVFGSGTIVVALFRVDHDQTGREITVPIQEWQLPPDKAYPWRSKRRTLLGYGYGLRLRWDDRINLGGKQVALLVKYVRDDSRVVTSTRQVLKVPVRGGIPVNSQPEQIMAAQELSGQ